MIHRLDRQGSLLAGFPRLCAALYADTLLTRFLFAFGFLFSLLLFPESGNSNSRWPWGDIVLNECNWRHPGETLTFRSFVIEGPMLKGTAPTGPEI
jgi:hypothetical protein